MCFVNYFIFYSNIIVEFYQIVSTMNGATATRGALIVIEGLDRSGKSTQCQRIIQSLTLKGYPVKAMKFPGSVCVCILILPFVCFYFLACNVGKTADHEHAFLPSCLYAMALLINKQHCYYACPIHTTLG